MEGSRNLNPSLPNQKSRGVAIPTPETQAAGRTRTAETTLPYPNPGTWRLQAPKALESYGTALGAPAFQPARALLPVVSFTCSPERSGRRVHVPLPPSCGYVPGRRWCIPEGRACGWQHSLPTPPSAQTRGTESCPGQTRCRREFTC